MADSPRSAAVPKALPATDVKAPILEPNNELLAAFIASSTEPPWATVIPAEMAAVLTIDPITAVLVTVDAPAAPNDAAITGANATANGTANIPAAIVQSILPAVAGS